ncbi:MAG: hypothetical protein COV67_12190 [Nitrospinae bacterium CG11_big_fil_rev_8_21_14_0_20_56_8]|nr:MAG: hypothetical protein COV67_12190 [Nitrospinae bacterium CG11_big_fil_rev_8_21_14_0_20_56_8]
MRIGLHYLFAVLVLSVYGGKVCPFISSLGFQKWLVFLVGIFLLAAWIRARGLESFIEGAPVDIQTRNQFILDFSLFIGMGVAVTVYNMGVNDFPVQSGLKILTGYGALGFFASADLALERQRKVHQALAEAGRGPKLGDRYFPITLKFTVVAVTTLLSMAVLLFLILIRDLEWLKDLQANQLALGRWAVLSEMAFVGFVVLAETLNLVASFCRNLKLFFEAENSTLMAVADGDFDRRVPVAFNDEFGQMGAYTNTMIELLKDRNLQLEKTRKEILARLGRAAEYRDNETGLHVVRMSHFCAALGRAIHLDGRECDLILQASPMHDIGKIGIPDHILLKPGKLVGEEWEQMKTHAAMGAAILSGGNSELLKLAESIALTHHEKWDGTGYPNGLKGEEIPQIGRIVAICDVFDALTSARPYKPAWPLEKTLDFLEEQSGKHFQPELVTRFKEVLPQILSIRDRYQEQSSLATA